MTAGWRAATLSIMSAALNKASLGRRVRELGETEIAIKAVEAEAAEKVSAIQAEAEEALKPLKRKARRQREAIERDLQAHAAELFGEESRTLELGVGTVKVRTRPPRLATADGVSWDEATERVRERRWDRFVVHSYRLDKNRLLQEAGDGKLGEEELAEVGLERVTGEESYGVKPNHDAIEALAQA